MLAKSRPLFVFAFIALLDMLALTKRRFRIMLSAVTGVDFGVFFSSVSITSGFLLDSAALVSLWFV